MSSIATQIQARPRLAAGLLALLTIALLLPFVTKPYTIDDPVFLYVAQHVVENPFDFYGFDMNWSTKMQPVHEINNNPPLISYYLALHSFWTQWEEWRVHLAMLLFSCAAVCGVFVLARAWDVNGFLAALLLLISPFFLVSASSVMTDVPLLAFYVWALAAWEIGLKRASWVWLAVAVVCASCAFLTKYFGITCVPLMFLMAFRREGAPRLAWSILLAPLLVVVGYELFTWAMYGSGQMTSAWFDADTLRNTGKGRTQARDWVDVITFLGSGTVATLLLIPLLWSRRIAAVWGVSIILAGAAAAIWIDSAGVVEFTREDWPAWPTALQWGLWCSAGVHAAAMVVVHLIRQRDRVGLVTFCWLSGTLLFAVLLNWSITARVLLPAIAASAVITARILGEQVRWRRSTAGWAAAAILLSMTFSLILTWADTEWARNVVRSTEAIDDVFAAERPPVYFEGHWGFQWYMEQLGHKAYDEEAQFPEVHGLAWPSNNAYHPYPETSNAVRGAWVTDNGFQWLSLNKIEVGAGFYSNKLGPIPFVFGPVPEDMYLVLLNDSVTARRMPHIVERQEPGEDPSP